MRAAPLQPFEAVHPLVPVTYVAGTMVLAMCAFHPVYAALSLTGALGCSLALRGVRRTVEALRWQLPLFALVCLTNPLFSQRGSTVLLSVGWLTVRLESLVFGLCMGMMLVASLMWLWCASDVLTLDRLLGLGGSVLPTVGLMASMVMRLVPQLVRRGGQVSATRAACSAARDGGGVVASSARLSGILLSWSLEDSIERSDAMRARGWQAGATRSHYLAWRMSVGDVLWLVALAALIALDALLQRVACSQWAFYPTMPHLVAWWGYLVHVVLVVLPMLVVGADWAAWSLAGRRA